MIIMGCAPTDRQTDMSRERAAQPAAVAVWPAAEVAVSLKQNLIELAH